MKQILCFALLLTLQKAQATPITTGSGPIALELTEKRLTEAHYRAFSRKRDVPVTPVRDDTSLFLATVDIGTPPQRVSLAVDTGSGENWVDPDCSKAGIMFSDECETLGQYSPAASKPQRLPALDKTLTYGDGSQVILEGYTDVWTWAGNSKVPATPFAVANQSAGNYVGLIGLSPDTKYGFDGGFANYSIPTVMANQGIIQSRAFSMGFTPGTGKVVDKSGTLIFGGIDKNRFSGSLLKTRILTKDEGLPYDGVNSWRYWIQTTAIKNNRPDGKPGVIFNTTGFDSKYLLDSGTTAAYLPSDIVPALLKDIPNPEGLSIGGSPIFRCDVNGSIEFFFGEKSIKVPYSAFALPIDDEYCQQVIMTAGNSTSDGTPFPVLGLGFLKAAYAVFDWDNQAIHLGQGANCGAHDLVAIGKGANAVPNVVGNCK